MSHKALQDPHPLHGKVSSTHRAYITAGGWGVCHSRLLPLSGPDLLQAPLYCVLRLSPAENHHGIVSAAEGKETRQVLAAPLKLSRYRSVICLLPSTHLSPTDGLLSVHHLDIYRAICNLPSAIYHLYHLSPKGSVFYIILETEVGSCCGSNQTFSSLYRQTLGLCNLTPLFSQT